MEIVQFDPAVNVEPHPVVSMKPLAPVITMPLIFSVALPVLLSVASCAALDVPTIDVKLRDPGESDTTGIGATAPVPFSVTDCGVPPALSVRVSVAAKLAAEAGVNVTEIAQFAPDASELPQVLAEIAKSEGFAPPSVTPLMVSAAFPVFVSVVGSAALVIPVVELKESDVGESEATGAVAVALMA
jgi:hypothetical protein